MLCRGRRDRIAGAAEELVSVPGLVAVGALGIASTLLARLFGPANVLREVLKS
jgi:hypothetical protein